VPTGCEEGRLFSAAASGDLDEVKRLVLDCGVVLVDVAVVDVPVMATCTYIGRADTIGPRHRVARAFYRPT